MSAKRTDPRVMAMLSKSQRQERVNRQQAQHINAVEAIHKAAKR